MIRKVSLLVAGLLLGSASTLVLTGQIPVLAFGAANAAGTDVYRQLSLFADVFERIRSDYVEQPDEKQMIQSAIDGMVSALDPHSRYEPPAVYKDTEISTQGKFGGLGIEITVEDGAVKVVTPIDDTPASKAGLLSGDLIVAVDGKSVQGMTTEQAVNLIRGDVGTDVTISIQRKGKDKPFDVKLTRAEIKIQSVRWRMEGDVGYIRITQFTEQTYDGLRKAIDGIKKAVPGGQPKGFILDLRNNPGGLLDQAVQVSDAFLEKGEILSTRGRHDGDTRRFTATPGDLIDGKPLIVLINGGSASASEIVSGALKDNRRATILGTRSFGKGSVQTIIKLGPDNGALRLTTQRYFTPSGASIQAKGIDPDIQVLQDIPPELKDQITSTEGEAAMKGHLQAEGGKDAEHGGSQAYVPPDTKNDKALHQAIDLIDGKQANAAFPPNANAPAAN